eukprot:GFUD01033803.1.p1 GENE.GFUD01033803.1~~GFUD01033803.1.p1  ORF type:complete len:395 (+),score=73.09 GFUD01033803.1:156-1340(+)
MGLQETMITRRAIFCVLLASATVVFLLLADNTSQYSSLQFYTKVPGQIFSTLTGNLTANTEKNDTDGLNILKVDTSGKCFSSVVKTECNGEVGNQISSYASLLYFQKKHGMQAVMRDWQVSTLAKVFQREKLQIITTTMDIPLQPGKKWEGIAMTTPMGAIFPREDFLQNINQYKDNKFIDIGTYPNYLFLYKEILSDLRGQLVCRVDMQGLVNQWMAEVEESEQFSGEIIYIGVHCRRTGYAHHLSVISNASLVDHHFFDRAFQIYRTRYNTPSTRVIFLAVSDELAWIKENFENHEDVRFGHDFSQGKVNESDLLSFDLCLLAACNHSIHTYGTYGQWGSLLAGGQVIAATGTNKEANSEADQINKRAAIHGWLFLDVRDLKNITEVSFAKH